MAMAERKLTRAEVEEAEFRKRWPGWFARESARIGWSKGAWANELGVSETGVRNWYLPYMTVKKGKRMDSVPDGFNMARILFVLEAQLPDIMAFDLEDKRRHLMAVGEP
jgi:hypothetical protein